jgi:hypothetical protein
MIYLQTYKLFENLSIEEKNKKWNWIKTKKIEIVENMDPSPIDIWYEIDDGFLDLKDKYGKFDDKYGTERYALDFDDIDVQIDIEDKSAFYTICHIKNYKWNRGQRIDFEDAQIEYSIYGNFDYQAHDFLIKNPNVKPFYTILTGFEHGYITDENKESLCKDLSDSLLSMMKRLPSRYNVEIINIEELRNKWIVKPNNISSLTNLKYPRISLSFSVNNK